MLVIGGADPSDLPAILALQRVAFSEEAERYGDFTMPPLTETLEDMRRLPPEVVLLKASRDGALVGSVRGWIDAGGTAHLARLIVDPSHQRRGVAAALLDAIEARLAACHTYTLFTGERSAHTIRLYERRGYRIRGYGPAPGYRLIVLEKPNSPRGEATKEESGTRGD